MTLLSYTAGEHTIFGSFESCHTLLKHISSWISRARVLIHLLKGASVKISKLSPVKSTLSPLSLSHPLLTASPSLVGQTLTQSGPRDYLPPHGQPSVHTRPHLCRPLTGFPGENCLKVVDSEIGGTTAKDFHCSGSCPACVARVPMWG